MGSFRIRKKKLIECREDGSEVDHGYCHTVAWRSKFYHEQYQKHIKELAQANRLLGKRKRAIQRLRERLAMEREKQDALVREVWRLQAELSKKNRRE